MSIIARRLAQNPFTRRDVVRMVGFATILVAALTAALSIDVVPTNLALSVGQVAPADIKAPRQVTYESPTKTAEARAAARDAVEDQYDYTRVGADAIAVSRLDALHRELDPVDEAFEARITPSERRDRLNAAIPRLSASSRTSLASLDADRWDVLRDEIERVLGEAQREEVRDSDLVQRRAELSEQLSGPFSQAERALAEEILEPFLVSNSRYSETLTEQARENAAAAVEPVRNVIQRNEVVVRSGEILTDAEIEKLAALQLNEDGTAGIGRLLGSFVLSVLTVGLLLSWIWRFRVEFWHRNNALLLIGLLLVLAVFALKLTAGREVLPYFVPTAAVGLLLTVLLSSSAAAVVMAMLGVLAATVTGNVEIGAYTFLGGFAGIIAVRRGERFAHFIQAAFAMALVNLAVIALFTMLGDRDPTGAMQLAIAAGAAAAGSALAAVGSFAVLGNLFGITTSFQLLELANPTQPLLRRLLIETPGTYHHSLMVGNLAERAAEQIGADPLLTRVAAYYHDIGKLANPLAFIENQAGVENIHDELTPEESAQVLKAHVANGIDIAYQYGLPTPIIAFIPQHHGTALMGYFHHRAQEQAIAESGVAPGTPAAEEAAASVDETRFRHVGPKPQSREAALIMLADGVEASVRSLPDHSEPAIRRMVERIIDERLHDGQFDETDFTLRDLDRTKEAFITQLLGMYHRRIEYPQNKIVELGRRRAAGGRG